MPGGMTDTDRLFAACLVGDRETAETCIDDGADPNAEEWTVSPTDTRHTTPLNIAAEHGHDPVVQLLLVRGADPKGGDLMNTPAIHLAAEHGHCDIVELLLNHGVEVQQADAHGRTTMTIAVEYNQEDIVDLLLSHG